MSPFLFLASIKYCLIQSPPFTSKISQFVILVYLNLRLSSTIYLKNIAICDIV
nr:MAG TPA: hypothetical protein [Caudoviricetes sp.]DAO98961.1 MAG TPA: hypothetical protein [Caudoviricetes sp.]DAP65778.1 MAG TPA: hypothetical protein [Caudoviricetes sp.]DAS14586.1 MAG TPA: hypothetical protein [Caudoviricetes sp.]DAS23816.1 MAG TPA: hypothetical protein [Caudoviricetes sp.]